jgi:nucleoside-diphosphate-sugar epimerase
VTELRGRYGAERVIAAYHHSRLPAALAEAGPNVRVDVSDREMLEDVVARYGIDVVYHLAAVLSHAAADDINRAWSANVVGFYNLLEVARKVKTCRIFFASSIAVFGESTPKDPTPQDSILHPASFYGISKRFGELLGSYYFERYGVDARGLRYPGIISAHSVPGERSISRTVMTQAGPQVISGSTDFVIEMISAAVAGDPYVCFVGPETVLPLMYIADCVKATVDLMEAEPSALIHRCEYNLRGMEFSAVELADEVRRQVSGFHCEFRPDERQLLADATARRIDESAARREWNWTPRYDLPRMVADVLQTLRARGGIDRPGFSSGG